jgi:cytochrome c oxidase subunit 2
MDDIYNNNKNEFSILMSEDNNDNNDNNDNFDKSSKDQSKGGKTITTGGKLEKKYIITDTRSLLDRVFNVNRKNKWVKRTNEEADPYENPNDIPVSWPKIDKEDYDNIPSFDDSDYESESEKSNDKDKNNKKQNNNDKSDDDSKGGDNNQGGNGDNSKEANKADNSKKENKDGKDDNSNEYDDSDDSSGGSFNEFRRTDLNINTITTILENFHFNNIPNLFLSYFNTSTYIISNELEYINVSIDIFNVHNYNKILSMTQKIRFFRLSDAPLAWGLYFQDGASPSIEGIIDLHNRIMFYLVVILFGVTWIMLSIMWNFNKSNNKLVYRDLNHGTLIELIWTVGPALVLVAIAFPSFKLLYLMDEVIDPAMTIKITGHQWYWEYEYADFLNEENESINFDSYMKDEASLEKGELRLLEVDNPVVVPIDTHIRFIITAADVLHSWAVPSLGIKVDACPGRLNQASIIIERSGHFYGQCSEICGVLHSSMPIKIEAVETEKFFSWLLQQ